MTPKRAFPPIIDCSGKTIDAVDADAVRKAVAENGVVVLRGARCEVDTFKQLASSVAESLTPYWVPGRAKFSADDLVQGVDPGQKSIMPHSEMAYAPITKPDILFFWVKTPCAVRGRTTLVDGCAVYESLRARHRRMLEQIRITWHITQRYEVLARMYGITTRDQATILYDAIKDVALERGWKPSCSLLENEFELRVELPALVKTGRGAPAFCDSWTHYPFNRSQGRWATSRGGWLGDLQESLIYAVTTHTLKPDWQPDDVAVVDNWTVMHGRESIPAGEPRDVRTAFGYATWLRPWAR